MAVSNGVKAGTTLTVLAVIGGIIGGCGPDAVAHYGEAAPDRVTVDGVWVYSNGHEQYLTHDAQEAQVAALRPYLHDLGYSREDVDDCLAVLSIYIWPLDEIRSWGTPPADGYQSGNRLHVGAHPDPRDSALLHEIAHWLQSCVQSTYDPRHEDRPLWVAVEKAKTS